MRKRKERNKRNPLWIRRYVKCNLSITNPCVVMSTQVIKKNAKNELYVTSRYSVIVYLIFVVF